ncbi:MAG: hypothetical protein HYR85_16690 [Planctomycetes bacterium]|nr:hypothetical protein [Planctomycetota bacterium]
MIRSLAMASIVLALASVSSGAPSEDTAALEKEAILIPFDLVNPGEFGPSTTIAKLLKRDDVSGVAIAFVSSTVQGPGKDLGDIESLSQAYRKRGVVILASVESSAGSKVVKSVIEGAKLHTPISLTAKQWNPFQRIAKQTDQNRWPWTFYVDKQGHFVETTDRLPAAESLDKIAKPEGDAAPDKPAGEGGGADAGSKPAKPEDPSANDPSRTISELTVSRPSKGGWKFQNRSEAAGEGLVLAKPLPDGEAPSDSTTSTASGGASEIFGMLGLYDAVVAVSTLDRRVHTGFGGTMVDPGSKPQLIEAEKHMLQKAAKSLRKVTDDSNGSLGGMNAAVVSAYATMESGKEYSITIYSVPVKKYTYIVAFAHAASPATEIVMQEEEIRKKLRFARG